MDAYDKYINQNSQTSSAGSSSDPYDSYVKQNNKPQDVSLAQSDLGDQSYDSYCQQFVEQVAYGKTGMFPSASDAWNNYAKSGQAVPGTKGIQPGDIVYFAPDPSNGNFGHTGIYSGNNKFISATYSGVQNNNLDDWQKSTGQQVLGYVKNPENLPRIGGVQ